MSTGSDILDALAAFVRFLLKSGVPGDVVKAIVDEEERKLPSPEAEAAADITFAEVIRRRFPSTDPPPEDK